MSSPKEFHIDAVYPEPLSRLRRSQAGAKGDYSPSSHRRAVKKQLHRGASGRFRTQPITFQEIQEVDEENVGEPDGETVGSAGTIFKSETDLKAKFETFYRSISIANESGSANRTKPLPCDKQSTSSSGHPSRSPDALLGSDMIITTAATPACSALILPTDTVPDNFSPKSRPSI